MLIFFCVYSPERMNPGDKEHTVTKILKVTSGSNAKTANLVDNLYKSIVEAGTHKVSSIKVAEASKIIENCQRDINIAFINELAILFDKLDLDFKSKYMVLFICYKFIMNSCVFYNNIIFWFKITLFFYFCRNYIATK